MKDYYGCFFREKRLAIQGILRMSNTGFSKKLAENYRLIGLIKPYCEATKTNISIAARYKQVIGKKLEPHLGGVVENMVLLYISRMEYFLGNLKFNKKHPNHEQIADYIRPAILRLKRIRKDLAAIAKWNFQDALIEEHLKEIRDRIIEAGNVHSKLIGSRRRNHDFLCWNIENHYRYTLALLDDKFCQDVGKPPFSMDARLEWMIMRLEERTQQGPIQWRRRLMYSFAAAFGLLGYRLTRADLAKYVAELLCQAEIGEISPATISSELARDKKFAAGIDRALVGKEYSF